MIRHDVRARRYDQRLELQGDAIRAAPDRIDVLIVWVRTQVAERFGATEDRLAESGAERDALSESCTSMSQESLSDAAGEGDLTTCVVALELWFDQLESAIEKAADKAAEQLCALRMRVATVPPCQVILVVRRSRTARASVGARKKIAVKSGPQRSMEHHDLRRASGLCKCPGCFGFWRLRCRYHALRAICCDDMRGRGADQHFAPPPPKAEVVVTTAVQQHAAQVLHLRRMG